MDSKSGLAIVFGGLFAVSLIFILILGYRYYRLNKDVKNYEKCNRIIPCAISPHPSERKDQVFSITTKNFNTLNLNSN